MCVASLVERETETKGSWTAYGVAVKGQAMNTSCLWQVKWKERQKGAGQRMVLMSKARQWTHHACGRVERETKGSWTVYGVNVKGKAMNMSWCSCQRPVKKHFLYLAWWQVKWKERETKGSWTAYGVDVKKTNGS